MSTFILMKVLESSPSRYDKGIRILTFGALDKSYDRLMSHIESGARVLDIGVGTGALSLRAALKGADIKGIDVNPAMMEIAQKRAAEADLSDKIELCEMGVAELGGEEPSSYDVVMSGLCFSELTDGEIVFTLREVGRILKPGGLLLIADEVRPRSALKLTLHWLLRIPLVIITYLLTQTTTGAVENLPEKVKEAGLIIESIKLSGLENFMELVARKRGDKS